MELSDGGGRPTSPGYDVVKYSPPTHFIGGNVNVRVHSSGPNFRLASRDL